MRPNFSQPLGKAERPLSPFPGPKLGSIRSAPPIGFRGKEAAVGSRSCQVDSILMPDNSH
ncbi:hypothetical protein ASPSYDRAFT_38453 [Aspergillus sydowii CBS 593.65]|uniref:Uncharacterized protein n=1 Tax=Aspergillus sydowii CBS 593.65 TaxID=1036612 RepID=A0A1L9TWI6_9EURO|nr:uncharacterized protein ASPSYDRAFT_38453 [Aspergillus sydowii CBS 593.65]OJJ63797.1 hypothetical protein ASPSYDRAFT_38453 [Aspergillus sydowii CBS 593.65]